jgi:hypothetical protein
MRRCYISRVVELRFVRRHCDYAQGGNRNGLRAAKGTSFGRWCMCLRTPFRFRKCEGKEPRKSETRISATPQTQLHQSMKMLTANFISSTTIQVI